MEYIFVFLLGWIGGSIVTGLTSWLMKRTASREMKELIERMRQK